ncbi:DUF4192 domain-containing protein [Streptomyces candidus]|uniref:DUF4192 domain-containing protein n=1 Tax=Streptomyces candidus TaxID=67283 RepID=A0A7X0HAY8_9ACTN|nr:DUF4192 domain-containing protein [Streptomyces candidus]MBB6434244.1 hypothetical protein [Streptomyces candidus]GHH37410.1 hypothetical protein GCM10018773_14130 [Streptomyces candidus]
MNTNSEKRDHRDADATAEQQITLRGPAQLADALPYLMGYYPNDSVVMVALHGRRGRFGGRLRLGIPKSPQEWAPVASHLAESLVANSERSSSRPDGILVFLCQDPADGATGREVMERLRAFAQRLRTACGALDVPVLEALCLSDGRFWSYCCPDGRCCPPEGTALALPGTSVMAAAAAYAGIQVRGSLREMEARLAPCPQQPAVLHARVRALDAAGSTVVPRILSDSGRAQVCAETLDLARVLIRRLGRSPLPRGSWVAADRADDELISDEEAATVIVGIQDRDTRDRAAEWMEGPEAACALRLWRLLARRCVGPYDTYAAPPRTLAGWVAWSTGDEAEGRVALGLALQADPEYTFAQLLHQACNEGLDPEKLRVCLRGERSARTVKARPRPGGRGARRRQVTARARRAARGSAGEPGESGGTETGPRGARPGVRPRIRPTDRAEGAGPGPMPVRPGARPRETPHRARRGTRSGR